MGLTSVAFLPIILAVVCFGAVSSLKCYSCFSYNSDKECESRYNLKEIECDTQEYDTCLKFEMSVSIAQQRDGKTELKTNKGYARYCGSTKKDCRKESTPTICGRMFSKAEAEVKKCNVTCCNTDLKHKCHERPHWPGTEVSTSTINGNKTVVHKGQRGSGSLLGVSIWFPLVFGVLLRLVF